MIHPSTTIHILDITTGQSDYIPVEDLFKRYADKVKYRADDVSILKFNEQDESKVKIQEWTGWTDLLEVRRIYKWRKDWVEVRIDDYRVIYITKDEFLPVYRPEETTRGYHGEVKFAYDLKQPDKITGSDRIRHRYLHGDEERPCWFAPVKVKSYRDSSPAYTITTKSKFYNGNNFHLWGSRLIPAEETEKCFK